MSETVCYSGNIRELFEEEQSFKKKVDWCKTMYENFSPDICYDTETIYDENDNYISACGRIFKVENIEKNECLDLSFSVKYICPGDIHFALVFYNGGTCFSEALQNEIERNKERYFDKNSL